jgi:hypothetical protein
MRIGEIETSVLVDTAFRESHYKGILKTLERDGRLKIVHAADGRRAGTFGDLEQYPALAERAVAALVPRWAPDRDRFDA